MEHWRAVMWYLAVETWRNLRGWPWRNVVTRETSPLGGFWRVIYLACACFFFSFLLTSYHVDMCLYPILYTRYVLPIGNWVSRPLCMEYNEGPSFTRLLKGANVPTPWIVFITDNARFHLASMIWINAIPCFTWYD